MAKEEPPSTSKDLQELQRKLSLLIASVQSNSKAPDLEEVKKKLDFLGTTAAHKALPSLGFSKQEYWSGLPFPSPMRESENESEVTPSCPTPSDPMDCSLPDSSAHAILQVVSFMKSPVGQYLDRHPFLTLTLLVFVAVSAVPVGFFLLLVVLTSLAAFVGVILLEGLVISVGGLSLLCVLCGLGFVSLVISGAIMVSYMIVSSLINYWFSLRLLPQHNSSGDCPLAMKSAHVEGLYQE